MHYRSPLVSPPNNPAYQALALELKDSRLHSLGMEETKEPRKKNRCFRTNILKGAGAVAGT